MPKAKRRKDPLPCGCVRGGKQCAEAKRLAQVRDNVWTLWQMGKATYADFEAAQKTFDAHREGK